MLEDSNNPEMASLWNRIQFMYLGRKSVARWALPLLGLTIVVIILRWATAPMGGHVVYHNDEDFRFRHIDEEDIHVHLEAVPDTRSQVCVKTPYPDIYNEKISIILDFHEDQFYDLRMTLESILKFTPDNLYEEIVLLDDGTGTMKTHEQVSHYLSNAKFKKVKAFRSDSVDGPSASRFKASKLAKGTVLVFLNSDVVVTQGWIQPLVHHVQKFPNAIAVPHADSILSGFRYFRTPENLINVFSLSLSTLFYESKKEGQILDTPVMTGAAFAVEKRYLDSLGSFDEGLGRGGGENLELSFRAWMCGGSVQINTCSRVAVRNALASQKITNPLNFQRIAELWMGDVKRFAYGQRGHGFDPNEAARMSLNLRKQYMKKQVQCSSFKEYLERVAPMIARPPAASRYFGQVRSQTGYCVINELMYHGRLKMVPCTPYMYNPLTFFSYDTMGRISKGGKCIEMTADGEVRFTTCDEKNADQMWDYGKNKLIESSPKKNKCLSHYYDEVADYNYLKAQPCVLDDRSMLWTFVKY